jgi:tungstate transport system substrate-binding protein
MRVLMHMLAGAAALSLTMAAPQAQELVTVASTTSTEQSGLFAHILPLFAERTGIEVRVVAQGTGQALDTGRRGDADVVFVHAPAAEKRFVAEGWGVERVEVMSNDFVLVGPRETKEAPSAASRGTCVGPGLMSLSPSS